MIQGGVEIFNPLAGLISGAGGGGGAGNYLAAMKAASVGANINLASAPATLDGITGAQDDRWFLKDQTLPQQNGVYQFNGTGNALTRTSDFDTTEEMEKGAFIFVAEGTVNQDTFWVMTTDAPIVVDTTPLNFVPLDAQNTIITGVISVSSGNSASTNTRTGISQYNQSTPFDSFQAGVDASASGDVIYVDGAYTENVDVTGKSGIRIHMLEDSRLTNVAGGDGLFGNLITDLKISGFGEFNLTGSSANRGAVRFTNSSNIQLNGRFIKALSTGSGASISALRLENCTNVTVILSGECSTEASSGSKCFDLHNSDINLTALEYNVISFGSMGRITGTLTANRTVNINGKWTSTQNANGADPYAYDGLIDDGFTV